MADSGRKRYTAGPGPKAPETHAGRAKPPVADKIHAKHSSVVNTVGNPTTDTEIKALQPAPETLLARDNAPEES